MRSVLPRGVFASVLVCIIFGLQHSKLYEAFTFTKKARPRSTGEGAFNRNQIVQQCRSLNRRASFFHENERSILGHGVRLVVMSNADSNSGDDNDPVIDAVIEYEGDSRDGEGDSRDGEGEIVLGPENIQAVKQTALSNAIRKIALLSLKDYQWRSAMFKNFEADRKMEESLSRMSGEEPSYVRPMHATDDKLGPLGAAEKQAVEWLSRVIEEEGIRAKKIAEGDGTFVRPMDVKKDASDRTTDDDDDDDGPLSQLERNTVGFFSKIVESETERVVNGKIRPMQLEESKRGPLGDAEARAMNALQELTDAELLRAKQQQARGGEIVRPIDIPGPLGEFERAALEIYKAEQQRVRDKEERGEFIVRPKDATIEGPLGKAEREAVEVIDRLKTEEQERARSIRRLMEKNRPMDNDRESPLGLMEALTVGLLRGPKLIMSVYQRVVELIRSEQLIEEGGDNVEANLKDDEENDTR